MKELLPGSDSLANQVSFYHILLLMLSLPFDMFYSHIILASFAIHALIQLKKGNMKPVLTARVLIIQSVFFVTVISTLYTAYPQQAFAAWGRDVVIFIFPLLFCLNTLDIKRYRPVLLFGFSLGCTLTVLCLYANAITAINYYSLPLQTIFTPAFTNHNFSQSIGMHATFFSMQLVIALVFFVQLLLTRRSSALKITCGISSLVLLAGLIQLSSKSILIVLLLVFIIVIPYCIYTGRKCLRLIGAGLALSVIVVGIIFNNNNFRARYVNGFRADLSGAQAGQNSEPRMARWQVAAPLVKAAPVFGHGAGSEITLLGNEFFSHKLYNSYITKLNAHNEYLSLLLKSGIWGLAIYLLALGYGFKMAIAKRDMLFISFMLTVAIVSLSENVLDVDKGVFFYGFFFTFLVFSYPQNKAVEKRFKT